jgi:DNA-binding MurR/RpiR family transcriptional regulator
MAAIIDQLRRKIPEMSPKMAVAARYAVDNPDEIAFQSMRSVALQCGVASPTMLRLARSMTFHSYEDFKSAFQGLVAGDGFRARANRLRTGQTDGAEKPLVARIEEAATANVHLALTKCDPETLRSMADAIRTARTTFVIGSGSMHALAALMHFTGGMALPNLRLPSAGDLTAVETVSAVGPDDAVLALAFAPYAKNTVDAMAVARERAATVMAISDTHHSPLLRYADHILFAGTTSPHYYPSFVAVVAVIEALLATVVVDGGPEILDRIAQVEQLRKRSDAYLI